MACHATHSNDYVIMGETPTMHASSSVTGFIQQEVTRPNKQWITHIIDGRQESSEVIRRTDDFVLLPDTERMNRWRGSKRTLNWLAIAHDKRLRTLRDLRGEHLPMLKEMLETCLRVVESETNIRAEQVMAYVHYPPSVYQLHVHFSFPYGQYCHRDTFRVHNLATVINNLEIDPDYYAKATLFMALYPSTPHFAAMEAALAEPLRADEAGA